MFHSSPQRYPPPDIGPQLASDWKPRWSYSWVEWLRVCDQNQESPMVEWFKCHTDFFLWSPTRKAWRMNELSVTRICFPINFALRHIDFPPGMKCKLVSKVGFYYNESVSLSITQNVENLSKWLCLYRSLKKSLSTVFVKATFATRISSPAVDTISSTIQPRSSQTLTIITIIWISPPTPQITFVCVSLFSLAFVIMCVVCALRRWPFEQKLQLISFNFVQFFQWK